MKAKFIENKSYDTSVLTYAGYSSRDKTVYFYNNITGEIITKSMDDGDVELSFGLAPR